MSISKNKAVYWFEPFASIEGTGGDDTLAGTEEDDIIKGKQGDDSLTGGGGKDRIFGSFDNDTIDGGEGDDTIYGGEDVDIIVGGDGNDQIWGHTTQVDNLSSSASIDIIDGGNGNDVIFSISNSTVMGGSGHDLLQALNVKGGGFAPWSGGDGDDTITVIDAIEGDGNQEFALSGDSGSDVLFGGVLEDTIDGGVGNDTLSGFAGDDLVRGQAGKDHLDGGEDRDTLVGGSGSDRLTGGLGGDVFLFEKITDSTAAKPDVINRMKGADTIDLSGIDANSILSDDQAFHLVQDFTGEAGELRVRFDAVAGDTFVEGDTDGDGFADLAIRMIGDQSDFVAFVL